MSLNNEQVNLQEDREDNPLELTQENCQEKTEDNPPETVVDNSQEPPAKRRCEELTPSQQDAAFHAQIDQMTIQNSAYSSVVVANQYLGKAQMEKAMLAATSSHVEGLINQINLLAPKLTKEVIHLVKQTQDITNEVNQGIRPLTGHTIAKMLELQLQLSKKETLVQDLLNKLEEYSGTILSLQQTYAEKAERDANKLEEMERNVGDVLRSVEIDITCPICLLKCTKLGDHLLVSLPCGHLFGKLCITVSLDGTRQCPLCRNPCSRADITRIYFD